MYEPRHCNVAVVADVDPGAACAMHQVRRQPLVEQVPVADYQSQGRHARVQRRMQSRKERMHMQEAMKERGKDRRGRISSYFRSPVNDRRRPGYERRNRTTVRPMPLAMAVRGDKRRFEDSGME